MEAGVRGGQLAPGDQLPPVRELADQLGVSPTTVAAAYGDLRRRGLTTGTGRAGTRIRGAPPVSSPGYLSAPGGHQGPDHRRPRPGPAARRSRPGRPGGPPGCTPRRRSRRGCACWPPSQLAADGIDAASLMVTGGALDGIERVLATWLTPADRVIVEDPGHAVTFDLVAAMGYTAVPVPVDDLGIRPAELAAALARGAGALIVTPAGPGRHRRGLGRRTGPPRSARCCARHPAVGVIEDDHAGPVAGVPAFSVCAGSHGPRRWVTMRSVSKSLGPDLRLAVLAGDEATIARVAGRQALGTGWVSYQLQELVADLWADPSVARTLRPRREVYARRGAALRSALAAHGITRQRPVGIHLLGTRRRRGRRRVVAGRGGLGGGSRASGSASPRRPVSGSPSPAWRRPTPRSFAADFARALRHRASRLD